MVKRDRDEVENEVQATITWLRGNAEIIKEGLSRPPVTGSDDEE